MKKLQKMMFLLVFSVVSPLLASLSEDAGGPEVPTVTFTEEDYQRLWDATEARNIGTVKMLLAKGAKDTEFHIDKTEPRGKTGLYIASWKGKSSVVEAFLEAGANGNFMREGGDSVTSIAAYNGNAGVIKVLAKHGVDVDAPIGNKDCDRPLMLAVKRKQKDAVVALLQAGADSSKSNATGLTPLHVAARDGLESCVEALVAGGADLEGKDVRGFTPLVRSYLKVNEKHAKGSAQRRQNVRQALLDAGASVDALRDFVHPDNADNVAHYVAAWGHIGDFDQLCGFIGEDSLRELAAAKNKRKIIPAETALNVSSDDLAVRFIEMVPAFASVDLLEKALNKDCTKTAKLLVDLCGDDIAAEQKSEKLFESCNKNLSGDGREEVFEKLITAGANLAAYFENKIVLEGLMNNRRGCSYAYVERLIELGARVDGHPIGALLQNTFYKDEMAARLIKLFIKHGADPSAEYADISEVESIRYTKVIPVRYAYRKRRVISLYELLQAGADTTVFAQESFCPRNQQSGVGSLKGRILLILHGYEPTQKQREQFFETAKKQGKKAHRRQSGWGTDEDVAQFVRKELDDLFEQLGEYDPAFDSEAYRGVIDSALAPKEEAEEEVTPPVVEAKPAPDSVLPQASHDDEAPSGIDVSGDGMQGVPVINADKDKEGGAEEASDEPLDELYGDGFVQLYEVLKNNEKTVDPESIDVSDDYLRHNIVLFLLGMLSSKEQEEQLRTALDGKEDLIEEVVAAIKSLDAEFEVPDVFSQETESDPVDDPATRDLGRIGRSDNKGAQPMITPVHIGAAAVVGCGFVYWKYGMSDKKKKKIRTALVPKRVRRYFSRHRERYQ